VKENNNFTRFNDHPGSHNAVAVAAREKVEGHNTIVVSRGIPSHIRGCTRVSPIAECRPNNYDDDVIFFWWILERKNQNLPSDGWWQHHQQ
jgi:hypothetical protein